MNRRDKRNGRDAVNSGIRGAGAAQLHHAPRSVTVAARQCVTTGGRLTATEREGSIMAIKNSTPKLDDVQEAIDNESNVARLLHRMAQDLREQLPDGPSFPDEARGDVDALVSELGRLEARLDALAQSLDIVGGAEITALGRHLASVQVSS